MDPGQRSQGEEVSIRPINSDGFTPQSVLGIAMEDAGDLEGVIVISFPKNKIPALSACCTLSDLTIGHSMLIEHWLNIRSGREPTHYDGTKIK
jgi:hypothetical protein